eukprot:2381097-Amphidinium_carterae.1
MLALINPSNYPTSTKSLKKMSDAAAVNRKKWYTIFVNEINKQKTFTQVARDAEEPEDEPGFVDDDWRFALVKVSNG